MASKNLLSVRRARINTISIVVSKINSAISLLRMANRRQVPLILSKGSKIKNKFGDFYGRLELPFRRRTVPGIFASIARSTLALTYRDSFI